MQRHDNLAAAELSPILAGGCRRDFESESRRHSDSIAQRSEPESDRGEKRNGQGEEKHGPVGRHAEVESGPARQSSARPTSKDPAERRAARHQQQTFGEQLAEEPAPARTHCHAQAELTLPGSIPRDEQHRDVDASDDQDQAHHRHEHQQGLGLAIVASAFNPPRG